jgi:hypothetical protein
LVAYGCFHQVALLLHRKAGKANALTGALMPPARPVGGRKAAAPKGLPPGFQVDALPPGFTLD